MQFSCFMPKIEFGQGKVSQVGNFAHNLGLGKVMLAADPYFEASGVGEQIRETLKQVEIDCITWTKIKPNPDCLDVDEACELARREACDGVVAVGGGSALDFGKSVAVATPDIAPVWMYTERSDHEVKRPIKALPMIAIPTTSGTGSETTPFAVLNNPSIKEKSTIVSDLVFPAISVIDPNLSMTMPERLTASTGFDAFAHAYESFMSLKSTPYTRMVAMEAMRIIVDNLPRAVENGKNEQARLQMSWASALAGSAIAGIGVTLGHSLGQPVGGILGAPHGESVAACTVAVTEMSCLSNVEVFASVARLFDPSIDDLPINRQAKKCAGLIKEFLDDIRLNIRFSDFGMTEADIDKAADIALTGYYFDILCHPRSVTREDIIAIYRACM